MFLDRACIALFLAALALPALDRFVRDDAARGPAPELRRAAEEPALPRSWRELSAFPAKYEAAFNDRCGLRDVLLEWNSLEKYFVFGVESSKNLLVGRDGWIFFRGDRTIEVLRGAEPLDETLLRGWQRHFELRRDALAKKKIRYVFVYIPNKESLYPERLPAAYNRLGPTRLDQLMVWMRDHSDVDVLDLSPALEAEKARDTSDEWLYYPHGTHWNGRGAWTAYRAIVRHLGLAFPDCRPMQENEIEWHVDGFSVDTWARQMYLEGILEQRSTWCQRKGGLGFETVGEEQGSNPRAFFEKRGARGPSVLFFHDSFGPFLWRLLPESFPRTCMCASPFDAAFVEREPWDVVVEMFVERTLVTRGLDALHAAQESRVVEGFAKLTNVLHDARASSWKAGAGVVSSVIAADGHDAIAFECADTRSGLESPVIDVPANASVLVRIDVESSAECALDVAWKPADAPAYTRVDRAWVRLDGMRNERTLELRPKPGPCRLLVRPGSRGVRITLHAFEVRAGPTR